MVEFDDLPGGRMVARGLEDLSRGVLSPEALVLGVAQQRLSHLGIELPDIELPQHREIALYHALGTSGVDDPYMRYNAMLRQLSSFLEALEGRRRRAAASTGQ